MDSEKSLIWKEIKNSASAINKAGGNTICLLLWSRGKSFVEVQRRIDFIISRESMDEEAFKRMEEEDWKIKLNNDIDKKSKMKGCVEAEAEEEERLALPLAELQRAEGSQYMS